MSGRKSKAARDEEAVVLMQRLAAAKKAYADAEAEMRSVQAAVIPLMQEDGRRTIKYEDGDITVTGTLVEPSTVVVDEKRLKRTIGARAYRKVCKEVLDKAKLNAALETGAIDIAVVATSSTEMPGTPYVKVTRK